MKKYKPIFTEEKLEEASFKIPYDQFIDEIEDRYSTISWITFYTKEPARMDLKNPNIKILSGRALSIKGKDILFETGDERSVSSVEKLDNQSYVEFTITYKTGNILKIGAK